MTWSTCPCLPVGVCLLSRVSVCCPCLHVCLPSVVASLRQRPLLCFSAHKHARPCSSVTLSVAVCRCVLLYLCRRLPRPSRCFHCMFLLSVYIYIYIYNMYIYISVCHSNSVCSCPAISLLFDFPTMSRDVSDHWWYPP